MFGYRFAVVIVTYLRSLGIDASDSGFTELIYLTCFIHLPMVAAPDQPFSPGMAISDIFTVLYCEAFGIPKIRKRKRRLPRPLALELVPGSLAFVKNEAI